MRERRPRGGVDEGVVDEHHTGRGSVIALMWTALEWIA